MKPIKLIDVGSVIWVQDDLGALKLITVDKIVWNTDPDLRGWDVQSEGKTYWIESCYLLEFPIVDN